RQQLAVPEPAPVRQDLAPTVVPDHIEVVSMFVRPRVERGAEREISALGQSPSPSGLGRAYEGIAAVGVYGQLLRRPFSFCTVGADILRLRVDRLRLGLDYPGLGGVTELHQRAVGLDHPAQDVCRTFDPLLDLLVLDEAIADREFEGV